MSVLPPEDDLLAWAKSLKVPKVDKTSDVASVVDDELTALGYPGTARLSILGDVGRENNWDRNTIFKGHSDPKNNVYNRGIISWQGDRQKKLESFLKKQGVHGQNDDNELRGMVRFMDDELRNDYPQIRNKLLNPTSTYDASEALRQYIKYVPDAPYNSPDSEFRVKNNATWAKKARAMGLGQDVDIDGIWKQADSYLQPSDTQFEQSPTQSPAIQPVNGQKPLLDPKTIGQQTVTTQLPVIQSPDVPIDADKLLQKRPQVMAEAQKTGKQPVDILLEMARGEHPSQQVAPQVQTPTVNSPQIGVATRKQRVQRPVKQVARATSPRENVDVTISDVPDERPQEAITPQESDNAIAVTLKASSREDALDQLRAYGVDPQKALELNPNLEIVGQNGKVDVTFGDLRRLGADDTALRERVAQGRTETYIPNLSLTQPKVPYSVERDAEQQLREEGKLRSEQEPSLLSTDDWTLAWQKILDDPSQLFSGKTPTVTKEERQQVIDEGINDLIKNAGSPSQARALQDEYAKMSGWEKGARHFGDFAGTIARFPATFARTAAWLEDTTAYLREQGMYPSLTISDVANGIDWVYSKMAGTKRQEWKQGSVPTVIAKAIEDAIPDDPTTRNTFLGKLSRGAGSAVPFLIGAVASGGSAPMIALLGAGAQVGDMYKQAQDAGLSREKQILAGLAGIPIGASEVLGLKWAKLGQLINNRSKGVFLTSFLSWLKETGKEATEETLQEYFQNVASDTTISALKNNGFSKKELAKTLGKSMDDAFTAGVVGAIFGGGVPVATKIVAGAEKPLTKSDTLTLLKAEGRINKPVEPVKEPKEVITENIPIVGTDVKKKTVNVKPAVEPVKQKIEEKVDEAWVNKILDPKGELTKEVEPKAAQSIEPEANPEVVTEKGIKEVEQPQVKTSETVTSALPADKSDKGKEPSSALRNIDATFAAKQKDKFFNVSRSAKEIAYQFAGKDRAEIRQGLLKELTGETVSKAKAGIHELERALTEYFNAKPRDKTSSAEKIAENNYQQEYLDTFTPLQRGRIQKHLDKPFRHENGKQMTLGKYIESYFNDGVRLTTRRATHYLTAAEKREYKQFESESFKKITSTRDPEEKAALIAERGRKMEAFRQGYEIIDQPTLINPTDKRYTITDDSVGKLGMQYAEYLQNKLQNKSDGLATKAEAPQPIPMAERKALQEQGYTLAQQKKMSAEERASLLQGEKNVLPDGTPMVRQLAGGKTMRGTLVDNGTSIQLSKGVKVSITNPVMKAKWKSESGQGLAMAANKGEYEQTKDVAERIERGEQEIRRLNPEGERGRIAGGRRNVEATLILAADARASEKTNASRGTGVDSVSDTARRQEGILEKYAKQNDIWFKQGHFPDRLYIDKGGEAIVYRKDENRVVKLIDPRQIDKSLTPQTFLDNRIALFNYLFPESHYEVMGFMRDDNGKFRVIVTQPFIQGEPIKQQSDVDAFMKSKGLQRTGRQSYANDLYEVHDLHEKNVIKGKDGTIYVIDAVPKAKYVQDFEVVDKPKEDLAKSPTGKDLIEALDKPVAKEALQTAKSKVTQYGTEMDMTTAVIANRLAQDAGVMTVNFEGAFFEPESTKTFIASVRKLAKATNAKGLEKFANAVEHQFNKEGVAVVYMSPESARHETIHKADYLGAINKAYDGERGRYNGASEELKAYEPFQRFHRKLIELQLKYDEKAKQEIADKPLDEQTYIRHGVAMAEALAYLGDGHSAEFGLTENESIYILATLVEGYVKRNGVKALDNFKGDGLIYEIIDEARGKNDSGKGRDGSRSELSSEREARPETVERKSQEDVAEQEAEVKEPSVFTDNEVIRQLTGETVAQSNQKNRQFAETMAMNLMDVGQVPYDPQTFKGWASGAFNIIERNGVDKSIEIWRQMPMKDPETEGRRTALGTTIAIELYNQGRQDDLVPFGVELTTHVGNAAQELVAAKLMSRLSPVFASMQGDKYTLKAKKRVQTPEERAKTDRLAEKLQESADNHDVAEAAIAEAEQRLDEWAKQEVELNKLLDAERKRNADLETALEKAQQGMAVYKDSINDTTAKTPDRLKKLKNEITAEEPALLNLLRQKFGGGLAMALKGAPPVDSNLEEDAFDALIKLGAKQLIDGLPKGLTPQQFDTYLQHLTQGVLNATELNYIHAMAYEMTKPVRSAISAEKRALLDNRLAHARRAKTVLGMDSEQVLKQRKTTLERQIKNLEEQIETGTSPVKTTVADTPEITALKEKRDALKQQLPQYQTNNVVNRARSKAIQKQIERLQDQINGRQQVKAGKPKTNEEVEALKAQRNLLREQLGRLNKVQKREGRELASEKVKAGEAYRDDKFAHTMLDVANSLSASQEAVLMAFGLRETPELKKLKAIYEKAVPDGKEFNKALNEGKAILDQTYRAIEQQRDIAKYGKDKTPEEIRLLKIFKDDQRDAERLAQKELEHHFEQLKKSKIRQVGDAALSLWNLPRAIVFGGDAGWLVAQGGLPALLHTKAWAKSVKGVTPALEAPALKRWLGKEGANLKIKGYGIHIPGANVLSEGQGVVKTLRELVPNLDAQLSKYGFTGQSFERAITQFYDSEIRKQLEAHGTKFEVIGNVADFSENFMSELGKKFPLLRQTNLAHNLATDLMRLNIGEELFGKVDAMYNAGKLTADEMVAAKDALARKWVNVITGKGYTPGWTHGLFKWLAQAGSAPSLALSSFQVLHYTGNPIAYYNMPKGARAIVAKKAGRMYGSLAILFGILGAIPGLINRDPEDKDFGVMDFSVISPKLAGMKVNILRQLKEPVRLSLGLGLKKLYYAATGNKEGSARINDEWFQELVMNDYGGIGSFWKGKAHPSISYLNTLWTGKTFTGEPAGTLDYVPSPLILKEGVQSATYDKKANILKSGKSGYLDDNWARFLTTVMLNQIGFGANSYEAADTTTAQKQIKSMMTGDDRSETDKMQSQKANQYERLIREGFTKNDLENDMLADVRTGNLTPKQVVDLLDVYEDEIGRFQRKYGVNNLSDSQKQTLMANRRAFKILDYVWGGEPYKMDWNKVNAALKFATPAENKLNDREAQAIAEGIILEALLKSPKMSAPRKDSPYPIKADNPRAEILRYQQTKQK